MQKPMRSKSDPFWNIFKGLGILCVVIGHIRPPFPHLVRFVYLFHLAVFFYASGFLYSENKYGDVPHLHFIARLRSSWPKYCGWMLLFSLLHNPFYTYGLIINTHEFTFAETLMACAKALLMNGSEKMGGALWFVSVLIIASGLFGMTIWIGRLIERVTGAKSSKPAAVILLCCILGACGVHANHQNLYLPYHLQTSLVVLPLYCAAWIVRTYLKEWMKYLHWIPALLLAALLAYGSAKLNWQVELLANVIGHPVLFYMVSLSGIYLCLTLAKYILRLPVCRNLLSFWGRYSFEIMAGHFMVFKLVDRLYAKLIGEASASVYGRFPVAFSPELCWLYLAAGLLIPSLTAFAWETAKKRMKQRMQKS